MKRRKGKVIVITGAGQGVGREIAKVMGAEGAKVVVNDLYQERTDAVAKEITDAGGTAIGVKADVTKIDEVKAMIAKAEETFGPVDVLVNNAGVPDVIRRGVIARTLFVDSTPEDWKFQVDLNIYGWLNCVYSGAKAGVLGFTKGLAREVGKHGVSLNCIALGATAHEGTRPRLNPEDTVETNQMLVKMLKNYPIGQGLGRVGRTSDAAAAIAFLASDGADYITGQCLSVSGGFSMM